MTSQFYADDIRNYNSSNEVINEFFNQGISFKNGKFRGRIGSIR